jgi:hypothetical protein
MMYNMITRIRLPGAARFGAAVAVVAAALLACGSASAQENIYETPPHNYFGAKLDDPGTVLMKDMAEGKRKLDRSGDRQMLTSLLKELGVSQSSQVIIFSKTSLQRDRITPWNPRSLFFNEDAYVGWVPGGLMELATVDSKLGPVFFAVDPSSKADPMTFDRQENCMSCHGGGMTNNLPGVMIRSVFTDKNGYPLLQAGTFLVDHTTPIKDRWGGWYVTGSHGPERHMGNSFAEETGRDVTLDREKGANVKALEKFFPTDRYLRKSSDIVALMVLEHQVAMQQRLTDASYHVRSAIFRMQALQKDFGEPVTDVLSGSALSVAESHADKVLKYMLFCDEAPLPEGGLEGSADFQEDFRATRRKTADGKSLKDFQLLTRLFKYRCSYMIYSRAFDGLPPQLKEIVYRKLYAILTAPEAPGGFTHLSASERGAILQVLRETKQDLPAYWREGTATR